MRSAVLAGVVIALGAVACGNRASATTKPVYDAVTGKLVELTYDRNHNGVIDTWTKMDGRCPISSVIDTNEDGVIDRWEYYENCGKLVKVGILRAKPDLLTKASKPDEFDYIGADGTVEKREFIEVSSVTGVEGVVRREFYKNDVIVRAEEDTDGDGIMDRWDHWETVDGKAQHTVEFDTGHDGKPDKRFTYDDKAALILIESDPDASGHYTKQALSPGKK